MGYRVLDTLKNSKGKTVVQSVFEHAIYISGGESALVKVINNKDYISPTSITIEKPDSLSFKSFNIREGAKVIINESELSTPGNGFSINLANASTWYPPKFAEFTTDLSLEEINLNLRVLHDVIYTCPSREGLVPLLENIELYGPMEVFLKEQKPTVSEKARPYIERLMWGLFSADLESVTRNAETILGLGPGLTPSCDDFLAGLILSLKLGAQILNKDETALCAFVDKASAEILRMAKKKTTIYSVSFLNETVHGEGPSAIMDLIYSVIAKNPDHVAKTARRLIGMGVTSGADISIGICYGLRFLVSRIELGELHETA
ncbi:MAG: DUF2877 domain-containing protein [Thermodesulfobacteriota bacterium]